MTTKLISTAKDLAIQAHGDQMYGRCTYDVHLENVQTILRRFGFDSETVTPGSFEEAVCAAGWVHDVLEDTKVTREQMAAALGETVTDIAFRVTDEPGETREERKKKTYPKIHGHKGATIVKLADRITNVEASIEAQNKHLQTYKKEAPGFRDAVYVSGIADSMWRLLEGLIVNCEVQSQPPWRIDQLFALILKKYPDADFSSEQTVTVESHRPGVLNYHLFQKENPKVGQITITYLIDFAEDQAPKVQRFRARKSESGE